MKKRGKYSVFISTGHGQYERQEREGWLFNKYFAAKRFSATLWSLDHIPTGRNVAYIKTLDIAEQCIAELMATTINWEASQPEQLYAEKDFGVAREICARYGYFH